MTPIAYALAIYHEARRRADAQVRAETGARLCTCGYCRLALYRMTVTVAEESRKEEAMTPDEEREIRRRDEAIGNVFALDQTATADRRYLLAALDEARRERDAALAREARLREAADAFRHDTFAGTDCRPEFLLAAGKAAALGLGVPVSVVAPLVDRTKAETIRIAREVGAFDALAKTWTCYVGGDVACGECSSCTARAAGFAAARETDPAQ